MLLHPSDAPERSKFGQCDVYEDANFFIAWKGFIFQYGSKAGIESIARLAISLKNQPLSSLCRFFHGIFVILIFDKQLKVWKIAVDNAGLYHVFHSSDCVGLSFLEILSTRRSATCTLCPHAVAEFLAHGAVFWTRTLVEGIAKIAFDEIVELRQVNGPDETQKIIVKKAMTPRGTVDETAFFDHYRYLVMALQGQRVSVDLTGGIDSRLVACLLSAHRLEFEVAVAGLPGSPEVVIAQQAADILQRDFHLKCHDVSTIEEELPELFRQCDGLEDMLAYHRSRQLSAERRRRGIDVAISGVGGELYKDFWWLQDWPFYNSKTANFDRLYDLRVRPVGLPSDYLVGDAADAYAQLRRLTIQEFQSLRADTNTESYDNVYFFYKMASNRSATCNINNYIAVVIPLLDYDNFLFGASLPRSQRFVNRFHRMTLSAHCPALANVRTLEGVTASIGHGSTLTDLLGFGVNRSRRLVKRIGERLFQRRWQLSTSSANPAMMSGVRQTPAFRSAIEDLKEARLLNPNLSVEGIRSTEAGRILTLGMLVQHISR